MLPSFSAGRHGFSLLLPDTLASAGTGSGIKGCPESASYSPTDKKHIRQLSIKSEWQTSCLQAATGKTMSCFPNAGWLIWSAILIPTPFYSRSTKKMNSAPFVIWLTGIQSLTEHSMYILVTEDTVLIIIWHMSWKTGSISSSARRTSILKD